MKTSELLNFRLFLQGLLPRTRILLLKLKGYRKRIFSTIPIPYSVGKWSNAYRVYKWSNEREMPNTPTR